MRRLGPALLAIGVLAATALPSHAGSPPRAHTAQHAAVDDTITVGAGQSVLSKARLVPGVTYHAVITGLLREDYKSPLAYELHDAFYCYETNWPGGEDACGTNPHRQEIVALDAYGGQGGAAGCAPQGACSVDFGSPGGKCCAALPYQSSHRYEQTFTVAEPGKLKVEVMRSCRPGNTSIVCTGSFTVHVFEKAPSYGCKAPWAARDVAHAAAIDEVHVVCAQPDCQFHKGGFPANAWYPAETDTVLKAGDEVSCDPDGALTLAFADNSTVEVSNLTQFKIGSFFTEGGVTRTEILLKMGEVAAQVCKSCATKSDFRIKSPTGVSSVRGTIFTMFYDPGSGATLESTLRGHVMVTPVNHRLRAVSVGAGREVEFNHSSESAVAPIGKAGARGGVDILKARDLVLAVIAKHNRACLTSTPRFNAYSLGAIPRGWSVAVKLIGALHGTSKWSVKGGKVKPANGIAKTLVRSCR